MTALENAVGSPKTDVKYREGALAAWTGPLFPKANGETLFPAFDGAELTVGAEHGAVDVFRALNAR